MPGGAVSRAPKATGLAGPFNTEAPRRQEPADAQDDGEGVADDGGSGELMSGSAAAAAGSSKMPRLDMGISKAKRAQLLAELYEHLVKDEPDGEQPDFQQIADLFAQGDLEGALGAFDRDAPKAGAPAMPSAAPQEAQPGKQAARTAPTNPFGR